MTGYMDGVRARLEERFNVTVHIETRDLEGTIDRSTAQATFADPVAVYDGRAMIGSIRLPAIEDEGGTPGAFQRVRVRLPVGTDAPIGAFVTITAVDTPADSDLLAAEFRIEGLDSSSTRASAKYTAQRWEN